MTWTSASVSAGAFAAPPGDHEVAWREVTLPARGSDDDDHWFRTRVTVAAETTLRFRGLATVCDVYVDREHVLRSESMFVAHDVAVTAGEHDVVVCARALSPLLAEPRKPRARWRSRVPVDGNLRWFRTSLLGRAPGFAPAPPLVGPWRPVELVDPTVLPVEVRTAIDGRDGVVAVRCAAAAGELEVTVGGVAERLPAGGGTVRVPVPDLWWPHTHGEPVLHGLQVRSKAGEAQRNVGFRQLTHADNVELDGLDLHVNGVPVFVRGAVWTPTPPGDVRATLERARGAGLNLIRIVGTMVYEDAEFHDACDELGLFVWQDLLFANMDYPFSDEGFAALAEKEVSQALHEVAGRPSLAVVCGNSEIEQQVAMLGLPPELGRDPFFLSKIPALIRSAQLDAAYVPSAPTGGAFPFRTGQGVANYFGVGAYLRPLEDVRRSAVRFASECLAFANVPDGDPSDRAAGVMRDVGAAWDFADVRDHYLQALHGITSTDERYWEHARQITGELMAAVFGEWRRAASTCTGGILLWLRDLAPGAGWGVLDSEGKPKAVWYHLRDALAPVAVWFVDEGLNGLVVHVANDTAKAVQATLRLALYRDERLLLEEVRTPLVLNPHSAFERDIEELLGRFVDVTYSYRFGDAQQDTVVASLHGDQKVLSQAFFRVDCRPQSTSWTADELGLEALSQGVDEHALRLTLSSTRVVRRVRLKAERSEPDTDSFDLEPGRPRTVALLRRAGAAPSVVEVSALNLAEPLLVQVP